MRGAVAGVALLLSLAACGGPTESAPAGLAIPPDSAGPDVVLRAYLKAVRAGDCATARQFVNVATFRTGVPSPRVLWPLDGDRAVRPFPSSSSARCTNPRTFFRRPPRIGWIVLALEEYPIRARDSQTLLASRRWLTPGCVASHRRAMAVVG